MTVESVTVTSVVLALSRPPGWSHRAECRGMDTAEFYDEPTVAARRACARCTVKAACLAEEVDVSIDEIDGYRGGMTPGRRRQLLVAVRRERPDDAQRRKVVGAVRSGASARTVAAAFGVPPRTVYRWVAQAQISA